MGEPHFVRNAMLAGAAALMREHEQLRAADRHAEAYAANADADLLTEAAAALGADVPAGREYGADYQLVCEPCGWRGLRSACATRQGKRTMTPICPRCGRWWGWKATAP